MGRTELKMSKYYHVYTNAWQQNQARLRKVRLRDLQALARRAHTSEIVDSGTEKQSLMEFAGILSEESADRLETQIKENRRGWARGTGCAKSDSPRVASAGGPRPRERRHERSPYMSCRCFFGMAIRTRLGRNRRGAR